MVYHKIIGSMLELYADEECKNQLIRFFSSNEFKKVEVGEKGKDDKYKIVIISLEESKFELHVNELQKEELLTFFPGNKI